MIFRHGTRSRRLICRLRAGGVGVVGGSAISTAEPSASPRTALRAGRHPPARLHRGIFGARYAETSSRVFVSLNTAFAFGLPPSTGQSGAWKTPIVTSVAQSPSGVH